MMNNQLKQILYEYANTKSVGMPLTAEEMLNAISNWLVTVLPECIDIETTTLAAGAEATATLTGSGTPDDHYVLKLGIPQGGKGDPGTPGKQGTAGIGFSDSADMTFTPTNVTYSGGKARLAGNLNVTDGSTVSPELTFDLPIEAGNGVNVDANEAGNGIVISAEGGGSAPVGVELTGASGTLTAEQLQTLEANVLNYIVYNNEIYTLADNEATAGYYTYSHCGIQNTNQTFIKCITITVSTRAWVKTDIEVEQSGKYLHGIRLTNSTVDIFVNIRSNKSTPYTYDEFRKYLAERGYTVNASGGGGNARYYFPCLPLVVTDGSNYYIPVGISGSPSLMCNVCLVNIADGETSNITIRETGYTDRIKEL